jgi:hypothetical protein
MPVPFPATIYLCRNSRPARKPTSSVTLSYGFYGDLVSHFLPSQISNIGNQGISDTINYTWVTDDQGR